MWRDTKRLAVAAGIVGMLLATGACESEGRTRPPQFDQSFERASRADSAQNPAWPAALASDCGAASARSSRPAVCIADTNKRIYRKGEPIAARLSWRNVPPGASIIVYLERDAPPGGIQYLGPVGALVLNPIPVSGDGARDFAWNGREFPCAPTDLPTLCPIPAEIGRYRLRAALYDRSRIAIVGWPSREQPVVLAHSASGSFVVQGTPDLQPIARSLWWAALNESMRRGEVGASSMLTGDIHGNGVEVFEDEAGRLCASIPAHPPYRSTLMACVAKDRVLGEAGLMTIRPEDGEVTGHVTVQPGAVSRDQAITLAQQVADRPYRPRVAFHRQPQPREAGYDDHRDGDFHAWSRRNPHATTYLNDSVSETIYRPDLGGAWVIVVNEIMAGGSVPDDQRFADKVLVLVRPDRSACVIETRPYRGGVFSVDLNAARFTCP